MNKATEATVAIAAVAVVAAGGWDLATSDDTPTWAVVMTVALVGWCTVEALRRFTSEYPKPTRRPFRVTHRSARMLFLIGTLIGVPIWGVVIGEDVDPVMGAVGVGIGIGALAVLVRHLRKPIDPERREPVNWDDEEWGTFSI